MGAEALAGPQPVRAALNFSARQCCDLHSAERPVLGNF